MSCRIITCLVFIVFTLTCAEGQFPRLCTSLASLKNKKCCPIPKGFSAPFGNDGNRGTRQELVIPDWSLKYSHYQPFQEDDGLMLFTIKRANAIQTLLDMTAVSASLATMAKTRHTKKP